jgi:quercetin dioxygenase-like cupin family protein
MIKRSAEMRLEQREKMRDGDGRVDILHLMEKESLPAGRLFSVVTLEPDCSIGSHTHTGETEFYYIIEGEGIVSEADGEKLVHPGDLVITGNGESHAIRNKSTDTLRFIALILLD